MAYISFQPHDYFDTKLYTGTGNALNVTGLGFQPDWTFIYNYGGTYASALYDAVRGVTKHIESTGNSAEQTVANTLTSFNSDGFTLGADTNSYVNRGSSPNTYASWNWKANGSGSSNTDGSVSATVSASATSGFSIVKYTNPSSGSPFTVGHGLGRPPKMIIVKNLSASQTWGVWHTGIGFGKYLRLDSYTAEASANLVTATSNTTFSTYQDHHSTGNELIAYCFADINGYQKASSFVGTGNTNGAFCYTGFLPKFVLYKKTTGSNSNWQLWDSARDPHNEAISAIHPDASAVPSTDEGIDILSNGFKIKGDQAHTNESGVTFIYYAVADVPLVSSNGVPATAR
ncbi:hypothetical protein [uncultured Mediterranean phage uvMED]|nr:hypothetical protein [uncultured Mediterranean phage uvMED]